MTYENNFSGLCIGGPYDGKHYTHWSSQLTVLEFNAGFDRDFFHRPDDLPSYSETCYDYVPLTYMQSVWVHETLREDGRGLSHIAFDRLSSAYTKEALKETNK